MTTKKYQSSYSEIYLKNTKAGSDYNSAIGNLFEEAIFDLEKWVLSQIFTDINNKESKNFLDFACGTGRIIKYISENFDFSSYTAMDLSEAMLEVAKKSMPNRNIAFIAKNVVTEPIETNKYDVITSFRLFLNLEKENRFLVLNQLNKMLKDGGLLIINNHMNRFSIKGFVAFLINKILRRPLKSEAKPGQKSIINTSTKSEFKKMLKLYGFEIKKTFRIAIIPGHKKTLFLPKTAFIKFEKAISRIPVLNLLCKDQIFICKKIKNSQI